MKRHEIQTKSVKKEEAAALCLVGAVVAFLGFCLENVFVFFVDGYIDNRNQFLPFLTGYGLSALAIYLVFGTPNAPRFFGLDLTQKNTFLNILLYFLIAFLCVSIGEIFFGYLIEWVCGVVLWNYSKIPLHITRYTAIPTGLGFAVAVTFFMGCCFEQLKRLFLKMNKKLLYTLSTVVTVALLGEYVLTAARLARFQRFLYLWKIKFW